MNQQNLADFIWSVADVLRGDFKQSIYGRIILPFTPRDVVRLTTTLELPRITKHSMAKVWCAPCTTAPLAPARSI